MQWVGRLWLCVEREMDIKAVMKVHAGVASRFAVPLPGDGVHVTGRVAFVGDGCEAVYCGITTDTTLAGARRCGHH